MLVDGGSEWRLGLVPTGDRTSAVVAGPGSAIGAARRLGLIGKAAPGDGMAVGMGTHGQ